MIDDKFRMAAEEVAEAWRLMADDPFVSEDLLRRQLHHASNLIDKMQALVEVQEDMLVHLRRSFWVMFALAFAFGCMMIWQDWK